MDKKGKNFEADYFLKEDLENKHRLLEEEKQKKQQAEEAKLKNLHYMKCPLCGHDLSEKRFGYIDIIHCQNCDTLVLAKNDVEKFLTEEKSILKSLVDFLK